MNIDIFSLKKSQMKNRLKRYLFDVLPVLLQCCIKKMVKTDGIYSRQDRRARQESRGICLFNTSFANFARGYFPNYPYSITRKSNDNTFLQHEIKHPPPPPLDEPPAEELPPELSGLFRDPSLNRNSTPLDY